MTAAAWGLVGVAGVVSIVVVAWLALQLEAWVIEQSRDWLNSDDFADTAPVDHALASEPTPRLNGEH